MTTTQETVDGSISKAPKKGALLIVFIVVFIDLLGFGIVLPIMPRLAEFYLKTSVSENVQGIIIGMLYASFSLMQFLFSPLLGRLSDRLGRRPILLLSLAGSVVFYGLFAFACSLPVEQWELAVWLMMASRIGAGISGASVSTAAAVIADSTTRERRAKGMALIGAAFGIGFTFGPLIAYFGRQPFQDEKWGVGAIASALSFMALLLAAIRLPETRVPGAPQEGRDFSISRMMSVLRSPAVGPLIVIYFLAIFAFANFEATLSLFTKAAFNVNDNQMYLLFAEVGVILSIAQGGLYRPLVGRFTESRMLSIGVGLMILGLTGLSITACGRAYLTVETAQGLLTLFHGSMAVAVTGFAFVNPSVSALVSKRSDPERQGEVLGVNQSGASMGRILGPMVGSYAFMADGSHVTPYAIAVAVMLFVIGMLPMTRREAAK